MLNIEKIDTFTEIEKNQLMLYGKMQICLPHDALDGDKMYKNATFEATYNAYTRKGRIAITIHEKYPGF